MTKNLLFYLTLFYACSLNAQEKDSLDFKNGINNPSLLSTHHFGIFISRINTNFKYRPSEKPTLMFSQTSGNNHHPFVEAYFPKDPTVRAELSQQDIWWKRKFKFIDQASTPADYMNIVIDAVIKEFRSSINIPLNKKNELSIALRSYLITEGKQSFSPLTSDQSIEWFHSNIAGGEDPFGRGYYGLNEVNFKYLDRNGNTLELNKNDFFIGGLEFTHYYYPQLKINSTKYIYVNFGSHLGINTSKFNPSIDLGFSANAIKKFKLSNKSNINLAAGANVLRKNLLDFKDVIELGNNVYLGTFEIGLDYTKYTKKGHYNSCGVNYQNQTRYNRKEEESYYVITNRPSKLYMFWFNGVYNLYKHQSNWVWTYTYGTPNYALTLFLKQDLTLNNAPDIQTGIGLKIPI